MATGIRARFLLGTYVGHLPNGLAEPMPSPGRLHAALLNAAGQGITAVETAHGLAPSPAAIAALEWLEQHPPTGLRVPRIAPLSRDAVKAFRKEGTIPKEGKDWKDKVTARATSDGYAFESEIGWCWHEPIPSDVQETLSLLCNDVGCLGESLSPVVLDLADVEATHLLDHEATPFDPGGVAVEVAVVGRTSALTEAHQVATARTPSVTQDRHTSAESAGSTPPSRAGLEPFRYREPTPEQSTAPWAQVLLVPAKPSFGAEIAPQDRVRWCVTLHRALISAIGFGASPLITGRYPDGASIPQNRVAIQYLSRNFVRQHGINGPAFAIMLPPNSGMELEAVEANLPWLHKITSRDRTVRLGEPIAISGHSMWDDPLPDHVRLWRTDTVVIPETAPQRRGRGANGPRSTWTLKDAALVSVGLVWRDMFGPPTGNRWFEKLSDEVRGHQVHVFDTQRVHASDVSHWVHKTPSQIVVQPYRATLTLGDLAGNRTLVAIGQSRHLGGGLLVPRDVPVEMLLDSLAKEQSC
ncbi:type I-U CRISPR-associated protein Csb2 [Nocardia sp. NPDC058705]|uniref:type I-G CRISPR-associated protein Csb2 n=1 Tax=Nocardia sp. NPDC058705 TaxID=3346609 RepID=UPI0036A9DDFF